MASEKTKKLLTNYLRKLTNLSGNNRSIFLPRLSSDQFIDLQWLSQLNGEKAFKIIEALIAEKGKVICPLVDARMEAANEASKKLKKLQRIDHFIFEERGSHDLHVGWPFVRGKFLDGTLVRCPLLFFPVRLKAENEKWVLSPCEGEISFNKSFLLAYAFYNQVKADEGLLEEDFEETDHDSTVFRTAIYQLLQKAKLDIHFNPDNYRDELTAFKEFTKSEFEEIHRNGELKLFPEAVLGIFSQMGSYLVPDYQHLLDEDSFTDIEDFFQGRTIAQGVTKSTNFLNQVNEEKVYNTFPLDVWQENALKASKLGHSIVVQGPPGTGKSQLICNLISDAMANGKRVLVVCQKRAALDVVYARMKEQHHSDFLSLIHDFKNDRKEIYQKIAKQIDRIAEYKARNISLDSIQLDRKFFQTGKRIDRLSEELEQFRSTLFDDSECGQSVKSLYLQSDPKQPSVNLKQEYQHLKFSEVDDFLRKLKLYCHYAQQFKQDSYAWRERKSFASLIASDLTAIKESIEEVPLYFNKVKVEFLKSFNTTLDWEQCEALIDQHSQAYLIMNALGSDQRYMYFQKMLPEKDDETSSLWLANIERVLLECFDGDGVEQVIPAAQLGQLQKALYRSMRSRRSLIGLVIWELFSKDKFLVKRALVGNGLGSDKQGFKTLEQKLDNRLNLEHNLSKLRNKSWLVVPDGVDKNEYPSWFHQVQQVMKAKIVFNSIRGIKNLVSPAGYNRNDFLIKLNLLFRLIDQLPERKEKWLQYLTSAQISKLTTIPSQRDELLNTLSIHFDALVEFDRLESGLSSDEASIFSKLKSATKGWGDERWKNLFLNSLSLAWIDHIEMKNPELRMASSGKLILLEQELREQIADKQAISNEILALRLREQATDDLEFNRLNNRVTFRDLHHQVTKKKKIWPLRKVVNDFENEIFKLLPCWLASPESVSAIFPMKELFDLVIFDEASQCFSERGIPSLYRGKQTVIAGDSKQLRPGDFYLARWQDEEGDDPDQEIDSLLTLAERYLLGVQLQGHYRSKSLALIDFSNRHFYGGKLQLLPDLQMANQPGKVIEYVKVEGKWENNANQVEAEKIVDIVFEMYQSAPQSSVGVITFNAPQQMVVLDALEDKFNAAHKPMPENLFVKNIENVQGDERDIIIFSVGYAPDKKGNVSAQFGSLNVQGGENRLNVAVSRAREKVFVVTSLWPEHLEVEETKNEGPKLLKKYLEYALEVSNGSLNSGHSEIRKIKTNYLKQRIKEQADKMNGFLLEDNAVPFYDLIVKQGNNFMGAILTDDENYYQGLSAKAMHALTPQLLEKKNWPFVRFYSRNFWQDRERFFNEVGKFVAK